MKTRSLPVLILAMTMASFAAILALAQQNSDGSAQAQTKRYPLETAKGLRFHNVTAEPAVFQGKKGLRATISEETVRRMQSAQQYAQGLIWIEDLDFTNGVIEAEI